MSNPDSYRTVPIPACIRAGCGLPTELQHRSERGAILEAQLRALRQQRHDQLAQEGACFQGHGVAQVIIELRVQLSIGYGEVHLTEVEPAIRKIDEEAIEVMALQQPFRFGTQTIVGRQTTRRGRGPEFREYRDQLLTNVLEVFAELEPEVDQRLAIRLARRYYERSLLRSDTGDEAARADAQAGFAMIRCHPRQACRLSGVPTRWRR